MPTPTSNPNAKVPGASPGNPSPGTVPNLGAGYKPPSAVVIDPDANPYYGQSKATNAQITGAGTGGTGTDVIAPSPVVQISSVGLAQTLGVTPGSYVPSGTTVTPATGQNSLVVAAPKASTVNTSTDNYYSFASNGKTINVLSSQYDSWTPQQQFAYQQSQGLLPKGAQISFNADGSWGYTTPTGSKGNAAQASTVLAKYTDSNGNVNLAAALLAGGVTADFLAQQGFTKQQITQAQEYNSVMTTLKPYTISAGTDLAAALASGKVTPQQLEDVGFSNDGPKSAIQQAEQYNALKAILNNPKNGIVDNKGGADLGKAIANGNLTTSDLIILGFNQQAVYASAILVSNFGYSAKGYTTVQLQQVVSSGKITKADLISAGFDKTTVDSLSNPTSTVKPATSGLDTKALKSSGSVTAAGLVNKIENETVVQKGASAASQPKLNTTPTINVSKIEANSQGIKITLGQKILNKVGNIAGAVTKEEASLKASLDAAKAKSPVFQTVSNNEKGGAITSILNKLSHTQPSNNNVNGINSVSNGLVNLAPGSGFSTFIESDAGVETASGGSLTRLH